MADRVVDPSRHDGLADSLRGWVNSGADDDLLPGGRPGGRREFDIGERRRLALRWRPARAG